MYIEIRVYYAVDMYTKRMSSVNIKLLSICYFIQHRFAHSPMKLKLFEQVIKTF